jgi:hypothetical protein
MKLIKLDNRHTGVGLYEYFVEVPTSVGRVQILHCWREWCWESFGPGIELRFAVDPRAEFKVLPIQIPRSWAWQTEFGKFRLYFKDHAVASAFLFQWDK